MARAVIPVARLVRGSGTVIPTAGTVNPTDDHVLSAGTFSEQIIVYVNNSGDAGTVSILPGANPPALRAGVGTIEIALGGTAETYFMLETAQCVQADGTINIDVSAGMAGDIAAYDPYIPGVA